MGSLTPKMRGRDQEFCFFASAAPLLLHDKHITSGLEHSQPNKELKYRGLVTLRESFGIERKAPYPGGVAVERHDPRPFVTTENCSEIPIYDGD